MNLLSRFCQFKLVEAHLVVIYCMCNYLTTYNFLFEYAPHGLSIARPNERQVTKISLKSYGNALVFELLALPQIARKSCESV